MYKIFINYTQFHFNAMEPFLFDIVNTLYNTAYKVMPDFLRERPVFSAFTMAAAGTYGLTRAAQGASKAVMNKVVANFDDRCLPTLEKICIYGIPAAALVYSAIDPEGAQSVLMKHPVYTAGMAGAYAGGLLAATQDLKSSKKKKGLRIIIK